MKKPRSELPFRISEQYSFMGGRQIFSENGIIGTCHFKGKGGAIENAEYIVESCNNYPRAVELLRCVLKESMIESEFDEDLEEFLLSINAIEPIIK